MAEIAARPEAFRIAAEVLAEHHQRQLPPPLDFLLPAKYGLALAGLERYDEAAEAFRQALQVNDSAASMHINLSSALELLGRPAGEWLPGLEKALQLEPDNPAYARRLARAYEELGEHEKAQALYHQFDFDTAEAPTRAPAP
jgi:predicted Zn-dependent protease